MSEYTYKKGMKPPGDVPGRNRKQFDSALVYLPKPVQGKPVIIDDISVFIKKNKYDSVFIRADKNSNVSVLTEIWQVCKAAGIEKISFVTAQ